MSMPGRLRSGRGRHAVSILLLAAGLAVLSPAAGAGQGGGLSPQTHRQLGRIHELVDAGRTDAALAALGELLPAVGQRPYERAVVLQNLGHVLAGLDRYGEAAAALEESLALGALPEDAEQQMRYNLAQLHLAGGEPARAVEVLDAWFGLAGDPPAGAWLLLGHAHAERGDYREAVPALQQAIRLADAPRADWYENLLAMQYELQAYGECAALLTEMIRRFPGRDAYWRQLAGVYEAMDRPAGALAVMELAWRRGRITDEAELLRLVRLYLYLDIPYPAARLLDGAMRRGQVGRTADNQVLLATAWARAQEREQAIDAYREAARSGAGAEVEVTLARLYLEDERWAEAARILEAAVEKPGLDRPGTAWLLLGIARYELDTAALARAAFMRATGFADSRAAAQRWLEHLDPPS